VILPLVPEKPLRHHYVTIELLIESIKMAPDDIRGQSSAVALYIGNVTGVVVHLRVFGRV
jgi:hypothetical protein